MTTKGIYLWLDSYDDIYSDFDSRHYQSRKISEDFVAELRFEIKNLPDSPNMILFLTARKRKKSLELVIAPSLHSFFTSQFKWHRDLCQQKLTKGLLLLIIGVMVMLLNSWLIYGAPVSFLFVCIKVLLEPAGWFLLWAGLDFLFYDFSDFRKTRDFYSILSRMKIYFQSSVSAPSKPPELNK